jgi:hypothetical protein
MRLLGAAFSDEQRLMQSDTGPGRKVTPDNFPQIAAALQKALTPERFSRLAAGRLVVTCDGRDSWSAWYESVQEPYFLLPLTGSVPSAGNNTSVIYGSNKASQAGTTFAFLTWSGVQVWRKANSQSSTTGWLTPAFNCRCRILNTSSQRWAPVLKFKFSDLRDPTWSCTSP